MRRLLTLGIRLRILGALILGFWLGAFGSLGPLEIYLVGMGVLTSVVGWWYTRGATREEKAVVAALTAAQEQTDVIAKESESPS